MRNYIILDSNEKFATALYKELIMPNTTNENNNIISTTIYKSVSELCDFLFPKKTQGATIVIDDETIILINAETELTDRYLQHQPIVEFIFWLRCRYKCNNPVILYSGVSVNHCLKQNAENFILVSPGCFYIKLPIDDGKIKMMQSLKPIPELDVIKPYLKPKVDSILIDVRHSYANYAGMALMLLVAKEKHGCGSFSDILIQTQDCNYTDLVDFIESLDYHLLCLFFNLKYNGLPNCTNNKFIQQNKKILIVDDLSNNGWQAILGQMIYGKPNADEIQSVTIHTKSKSELDEHKTIEELEAKIKAHKPHLILLDLRLSDGDGKKRWSELGGFRVLKHLKNSPIYKGVPVIMFTASNNSQTVKHLIGNGAYCVWTKPGIDEGLSENGIVKRYEQLVKLVDEVFNPDYKILNEINDSYDQNFQINTVNLEEIRNLLLKKLDFIRYRLNLYDDTEKQNLICDPYRSANAIYIDANTLFASTPSINFHDIISSVTFLAIVTASAKLDFVKKAEFQNISLPKVVIMNAVFDELLKFSKKAEFRQDFDSTGKLIKTDLCPYRAAISQFIIKSLFNDKLVRTELSSGKEQVCDNNIVKTKYKPVSKLQDPKENVWADGYILDEIGDLVLENKTKFFNVLDTTQVLFISGDNKLKNKLSKFKDPAKNNLLIKSNEEFCNDIFNIKF